MADEIAIPLLPCASIDVIADFYEALGFRIVYRQTRPNPYVGLQREDLQLHFFGMPEFEPENSYGTCAVLVPDIKALYRAFADGLRVRYGRVPLSGIPRMTRPRARKNNEGVTGFSVIDPGGNWIRISALPSAEASPPVEAPKAAGRLASTMENAVVLADSHGDHRQAARILDSALRKVDAGEDPVVVVEALAYRAELAVTLEDPEAARAALARVDETELTVEQRERAAEALANAAELRAGLPG
ncbi:bleomycin resistance protein [Actinoplanes aureus]|uniref:VOC family protein n=1 Tax=Actinoplanes aureus TaxID=2792083 RepID=A0A931C911_9ACTN|nr:VOC family protein [Actinoplanes aureus]MBG0563597.1 VOC family protein [Actinoplanes aureus]